MKTHALWKLLRCPSCKDALAVESFGDDEGLLRSSCGAWFPVVNGIPRIFVGEMRAVYDTDFADFFARHNLRSDGNSATTDETRQKLATRESFGFEWTHFSEMLPDWEKNAHFYFEPLGGAAALDGKLCFEGGCGKGRHTYYALKSGARVVAVDFSRAVDVAQKNCERVAGERLFVQADLMALPFDDGAANGGGGAFDVAYSLGVLHHLPDPEAGFRNLSRLVKAGGQVLIYVYHALEGEPVKRALLDAVNVARRVTTRLPHRMLLPMTNALGYGLYAGVVMPYRLMSRVPLLKPLADKLPLRMYADYPVRVIVNDQFDRFSAPIENRYTRAEVAEWLNRAGLANTRILPGYGWRATGQRQ
jgi:SAM-dependent methyltransferase